jgi:hypothetical protein
LSSGEDLRSTYLLVYFQPISSSFGGSMKRGQYTSNLHRATHVREGIPVAFSSEVFPFDKAAAEGAQETTRLEAVDKGRCDGPVDLELPFCQLLFLDMKGT